MTAGELILYATPIGPMADALADLFLRIDAAGPTMAQAYPPHCTLTGFFHRSSEQTDRIMEEVDATAAGTTRDVRISRLRIDGDWIGLELASLDLTERAERFAARHQLDDGDDPVRLKDWLHLSIAYGDADLSAAAGLTRDFDIALDVEWRVDLWQRNGDGWRRLT